MQNILITGGSGYFGGCLVERFEAKDGVKKIVGLDVSPPKAMPEKLVYVQRDVRQPIDDILKEHDIDTVIHAAWILPPIHDRDLMVDINVGGTKNVLAACAAAKVERVFYTSSTTAYGFHPDNDYPLREDSALRGNEDFTYAHCKRLMETEILSFAKAHPDITVCWARPSFVVGPGFANPLAKHLQKPLVALPRPCSPMQFVHEDDLVRAIDLLLEKGARGVYNIGGDGELCPTEMARILGNIPVQLPVSILGPLNNLAWNMRMRFITDFPSPALNLMRYAWVADNSKLKNELGFEYQYDTRTAFEDFAAFVKGGAPSR